MADASQSRISRRALLKAAGAPAATAAAADVVRTNHATEESGTRPAPEASAHEHEWAQREPLEALTADEAALLTAIAARLIPSDADGPGAVEAGAIAYIDRALAGFLAPFRELYRRGLAALERYARSSRGKPFRELSTIDQDSLLIDVETGAATGSGAGFDGSSAAFFAMLRAHIWQGTFGDPYYGGNRDYIGWNLIGYPGVRTAVTPDQQRLGTAPPPLRRSAYDSDMFTKATARLSPKDGLKGGHS
jgi:gluconate 2-dehydrogenase gamma chain